MKIADCPALLVFVTSLELALAAASAHAQAPLEPPAIRHSYFVLGPKTAIIAEDGNASWEYRGGSRDGFILPNGNALIAWSDAVEEVTPAKKVVLAYRRSPENSEIGTTARLWNGNTLVTELGRRPRLLELN